MWMIWRVAVRWKLKWTKNQTCICVLMHLCICVFVYNVDDTDDDILMIVEMALIFSPLWNFIPQNIQNSIATKMMPKMQTMMCWWWYCGLSIKNIIFYHPGFPHPVIFSLQWPYTRKSRFQFAPILQTFAGFFMFWGSGSLEVGKSKKSEKRRKLSGVIFQTRSSQTLIFFHILNIFNSWQLLCFKGWLHWCYFLLFSLRKYLANQFPKIIRYLLKGLIQQHDPRTLSLSLSSSLSSSLSWFSTRIPGLCLCPNRFQESGNILRSQILQKNFFF